jgi:hypothetical protein
MARWFARPSEPFSSDGLLLPGWAMYLDGIAHLDELLADLATQEDEGDDRDDGDESEDKRVFGQTLTSFRACAVDLRP